MELDSLKALWQNLSEDVHQRTDEEILSMLQKESKSPIAKMKRNLRWELVAVIIMYSAPIIYFMTTSYARYWELAAFMFLIGVGFIFYYYHKNKLLHSMQCVTCEVRSNLETQLKTLGKYIRFYFIFGTILVPIAYVGSAMIVFLKSPVPKTASIMDYLIFIGVGILLTVFSYFLNTWYVNKLYGQHMNKLKELLSQMEEK